MLSFFHSLRRSLLDERFVLHRYKSTSHASAAAALVMGGWYLYELYVKDVIRWDFLIIMGIMALVKIAFLIWYKVRD
jgi:hypothetical protein